MTSSGSDAPKVNKRPGLTLRVFASLVLYLAVIMGVMSLPRLVPLAAAQALGLTLGVGLITALALAFWVTRPLRTGLDVLDAAVKSYRDGDYGIRLAPPKQPELAELTHFFNTMITIAMEEHGVTFQKELVLDTLVQSTPMAIMLVGPHQRLVLANQEARLMFGARKSLTGMAFDEILSRAPEEMRQAMASSDALFHLEHEGETETLYLNQRTFRINTVTHRLVMIKRLTRELKRQEVETWKKLIRLINHELNNTLAPLRSLTHSARTILARPDKIHKLEGIFDTMDKTTLHLQRFLEDYATFARMPSPRTEKVAWQAFLDGLNTMTSFRLENELEQEFGIFDPGQLQQVLINLIKNAREASDGGQLVTLYLANTVGGETIIQVRDRGKGMKDLDKALLPFFSTKKTGTGLGLPLCREIMEAHGGSIRIQNREGGGIVVTCRLPAPLQ